VQSETGVGSVAAASVPPGVCLSRGSGLAPLLCSEIVSGVVGRCPGARCCLLLQGAEGIMLPSTQMARRGQVMEGQPRLLAHPGRKTLNEHLVQRRV